MRHFTPLCARSSLICNKIRKWFRRVWIIYPPQKRLNGLATTQRIWLNLRFISSREPMYATFPRSNWHKKRCASAVTGANKNRASVHSIQTDARLYYTCGSVCARRLYRDIDERHAQPRSKYIQQSGHDQSTPLECLEFPESAKDFVNLNHVRRSEEHTSELQ